MFEKKRVKSRRRNPGGFSRLPIIAATLFGLIGAAVVGAAGAAATGATASAWPAETLVYAVRLNGVEVGRETVDFHDEMTGVTIRSVDEFARPVAMTLTANLTVNRSTLAFQKYVFEAVVGANAQKLTATPAPDGLAYHVEAGGRAQDGKLRVAAGFLVLDNNITSQYNVLIRRYLAAGEAEWTMVVPQVMMVLPIKVADATPTSVAGDTADARLPAGVAAREVTFANGDVRLVGTLTLPAPEAAAANRLRLPVAILVHGSGPMDRNENSVALTTNVFRDLAYYLAARGVAVLRYDKRGIGQSTGNLAEAKMTDLVADVKAAVACARTLPEVDPRRVILIGHSEGAILAPIVAAEDSEVAAVVLLAGAARSLDKIITDQVLYMQRLVGASEEQIQEALKSQEEFYALAKSGVDWGVVQGQMTYLGWFREHFLHDPLATIVKVKAPLLILQGEKDFQVPKGEATALGEALDRAGHQDHQVVMFPNLDHLFMFVEGQSTLQSYMEKERRLEPAVLATIGDWLAARGLAR